MDGFAGRMRIAPNLTTTSHRCIAADFSKLSVFTSIQFNPRVPKLFPTKFKNTNLNAKLFPSRSTLLRARDSYTTGVPTEKKDASSSGLVGENDLLIVGPGVLGRLVAERWRKEYPSSQIHGRTATTDHHDDLIKMGINPSLKGSRVEHQFPNVIFCAPPSRSLNYPGDLREAALNWNEEGGFLFTSSSALYEGGDNGQYDEDSPTVPLGRNPKTDILLEAEQAVLEHGGCVLRLAGLYKLDRGAHTFWLRKGVVESRPDHFLNLIHYEDAASLSVAILKKKLRGRVFLGCDNHPVTRQDLMDVVMKSGQFEQRFEGFTGTDGPLGKKLNNSKTREEIEWKPRYPRFSEFLGVSGY